MKMCEPHWEMLRQAIKDRGMWHLVADSAEEAGNRIAAMMRNGGETKDTFDPLMACNNMIMSTALQMGGGYLLAGNYCPICECVKHMEGKVDAGTGEVGTREMIEKHWTAGPADEALRYAIQLGAMAPAKPN